MTTDPYRLSLAITAANGLVQRWGGDELNSKDVPTGLSFSTSIPGGFKAMTCSLMRRLDIDYPDEALFDDVKVLGPGNAIAWEGRMAQFPRQHADQFSVNPGAIGWSAHLLDDPSFREIYCDRDLTHWGPVSSQWRLDLVTALWNVADADVQPDASTGVPTLRTAVTPPFGIKGICTAIYDAGGGLTIGRIYYAWKRAALDNTNTNYLWRVQVADDDRFTVGFDSSGDLRAAGPAAGQSLSPSTTRRFAGLQLQYNAVRTDGDPNAIYWGPVNVIGTHGLTLQGPSNDDIGVYGSDVIADVIERAAPLLNYSTGPAGSISRATFIIPHLVFQDPVTAEDAISLVNGFFLYEWGVYDDRMFFWRPPDPNRCTWEARLSDGAQVSLEGDDANNIFNGVYVSYTDTSGKRQTVGPPGSAADATDATLADTNTTNPVNAHGIPRRWGRLDLTNTTTLAGATQVGAVWLAEHNLPARRGQLTLQGLVQHPVQGMRPVWAVRAGDYIRIADRPNDPARRIIETNYDHDARQLTASLDQTVFKLEAIMERMGVNLVGVI